MRNPRPDRTLALPTLAILALAQGFPSGVSSQLAPIGLSEVGGRRLENENLIFFVPESGDRFGSALAAGDFNGDGASDLATGIPFDNGLASANFLDCGIVVVRYGAPGTGFAEGAAETVLYQGLVGSPSEPDAAERFGEALAAGDFNGDEYDDLAVGAPYDRFVAGGSVVGSVLIYYGGPAGIEPPQGAELLHRFLTWQEIATADVFGEFGSALAVGNFDGDEFDDLAIGAPNITVLDELGMSFPGAGAVFVAHGSADGILPLSGYGISQAADGLHGELETGDRFGAALAAGDFDGDGQDDLAIGVPEEDDSGAVNILFGSDFGLIFSSDVYWLQWAAGLEPETGDLFGLALAAGDLDGDGHDELVIGSPGEDLGILNEHLDAGQVSVFHGSPALFDYARTRNFTQGAIYEPAEDEDEDRFGWAVAAGDFDGDGRADLVVAHPGEDLVVDSGALTVLMGGPGAALGERVRLLASGVNGLPGSVTTFSQNGWALAVGDFDGTGFADLAFGAPYQTVPGVGTAVGDVKVLLGSLFADGFAFAGTLRWSSAVP